MTAGESWLGNLPPSWEIRRLGALGTLSKGRGGSKNDNRDRGNPVVRYGELYTRFGIVIAEACSFIDENDMPRYTPLPFGSIVFAGSGEDPEDIGKSALSRIEGRAFVGGDTVIFTPKPGDVDPMYLAYVLESRPLKACKALRSTGFTVVHITAGKLKSLPIPLPVPAKQRRIADFLDVETAQIDALIAEQQRFIGLLGERKLGLIAHRTLGGRDPFRLAPDRSLPFASLGRGFSVTLGKMLDGGKAARESDLAMPYIRAANVRRTGLDLTDVNSMPFTVIEAKVLDLRAGDILVIEGGATVGVSLVLEKGMPGWSFQKTVNRLRLTGEWNSKFVSYVLTVYREFGVIDVICNKSTIPHLTAEKLRAMPVPVPPPAEQAQIADYLDERCARIDALIAEAEHNIALSKERRAALITAAVTGQIEVPS